MLRDVPHASPLTLLVQLRVQHSHVTCVEVVNNSPSGEDTSAVYLVVKALVASCSLAIGLDHDEVQVRCSAAARHIPCMFSSNTCLSTSLDCLRKDTGPS